MRDYRTNRDKSGVVERDYRGNFSNTVKVQDDIEKMTRPLTDKEVSMIEAFIKRQKELENE